MLKFGILLLVNEPTRWVNQRVITDKHNGKLRICLDTYNLTLNEALCFRLIRLRYFIPSSTKFFNIA